MSAVWSIAGNVVTLTLDGSDSGPISRSRTFTGLELSELYTFYLVVDTDTLPVHAFLEVVGGDQVIATVSGGETLTAQGETDGSGEITVRFGVLLAEGVGTGSDADDLDYANIGAMHSAGWAKTDTITATGWFPATATTDTSATHVHGGNAKALKVEYEGYTFNYDFIHETFVYTGYTPGAAVTAHVWAYAATALGSGNHGLRLNGDNSLPTGYTNYVRSADVGSWKELFVSGVADGSGNVTIDLGVFRIGAGSSALTTIYFNDLTVFTAGVGAGVTDFSDLTYCLGSGVGDGGTGNGGDPDTPGDDPPPDPPPGGWPPPPVPAERPFGIWNISAGGFAYWDTTVKQATPQNVVNLINQARTAGGHIFLVPGAPNWLDSSGRFSPEIWKSKMLALYTDPRSRAAIEAGIADGTVYFMLIDEPYHQVRYGYSIPLAVVESGAVYFKTLFPDAIVAVHVSVVYTPWMTRHINGVDWIWAEYSGLSTGDPVAWREDKLDRTEAFGHGLILGIHWDCWLGDNARSGRPIRPATPAEVRHYGGIMASTSRSVAFVSWRWTPELWGQPGMPDAVRYVRDTYVSFQP